MKKMNWRAIMAEKKTLLVAVMAMCCVMTACADNDKMIGFDQLPAAAQTTVKKHFGENKVAYCKIDKEFLSKQYEVRLEDGTEIEFESDGSLRKVDCKQRAVPKALVPEEVSKQVKASFPKAIIVEWGKEDRGWKAELNNGLEVKFNSKLKMTGIDD